MVFWGAEVKPGKPYTHNLDEDAEYEGSRLHLSQATLGLDGKSKERTVVKCKVGDGPELLLCSLTPGVSESCSLDLLFDQDVVFSVTGSTSVHLVGYYIPLDDEGDDDDYDAYGDSDLEDSEDVDLDEEDDSDVDVPTASTVKIEEITDRDTPASTPNLLSLNDKEETPAKESKKASKKRRQREAFAAAAAAKESSAGQDAEVSEDVDGFPVPSKKKQAVNGADGTSTPTTATPSKKSKKGKKISASADGNKAAEEIVQKSEVSTADVEMEDRKAPATAEKSVVKTPKSALTNNGSSGQKNPAKTPAGNGAKATPGQDALKKSAKKSTPTVRKFPNGLEIEQISMGKPDAKQTKPGKKVSVYYTGKLKSNGRTFDSNIGKKPFLFRLGVGEVIKGWDVGVGGMRIGDKRRITVPPAMGYGGKGVPGTIPGNAWLVFDVELVDVGK